METSSQSNFLGIYAGTYTCSRGENGITVSVDSIIDIHAAKDDVAEISARLWFYDIASNPGHPTGAFNLAGIVNSGSTEMEPGEWISDEPSNWGAAGIKGEFLEFDGGLYLTGKPTGPGTGACETFTLSKLSGL